MKRFIFLILTILLLPLIFAHEGHDNTVSHEEDQKSSNQFLNYFLFNKINILIGSILIVLGVILVIILNKSK
ncbi:MAG: hypothetical protein Q7S27_00020 [Nanoarchaeota archaeon]|nr:hypothetical protein [Nanoarchaeota archaeon]